jgi:hypothetical protein
MGTIYLANILHTILLYSKYIPFNVSIISTPFMIIIIFEYTSNILHPIIFFKIHKIHLYIFIGLQLMGHTLFLLDEN